MSFPADEHSFQFQHSRSSLAASYDILSQYLQSSVRLSIVTCFYGVQLGKQKGYLSMRNGFRSLDETVQSRRRELRVSCNGFHLKTSKKKNPNTAIIWLCFVWSKLPVSALSNRAPSLADASEKGSGSTSSRSHERFNDRTSKWP